MFSVRRLTIAGRDAAIELVPDQRSDERGFFSEVYNKRELSRLGFELNFVQDNHSLSRAKGTVRGLHFQSAPFAQTKLIRVVRGAILDIAVDIRRGSPTYGQHIAIVVSAQAWNQVLVPVGFAHGFCTLVPDTEVLYKVDAPHAPEHDHGLLWCDPDLGIDWPVDHVSAVVSDKDKRHPRLKGLPEYFNYGEAVATD